MAALNAEGGMLLCLFVHVGEIENYVRLIRLREPRIVLAQSLGHLGASVGKGYLHSLEAWQTQHWLFWILLP